MQTKTIAHVKKPVDIMEIAKNVWQFTAHQEHVPNCMRPMINKKLKILSELTEHTLANEIEAPKEVLRKEFQK